MQGTTVENCIKSQQFNRFCAWFPGPGPTSTTGNDYIVGDIDGYIARLNATSCAEGGMA